MNYSLSDTDVLTLCPDANFHTYTEIAQMRSLDELFTNGNHKAFILYLTADHYGHFCCIFIRDGIVSFFDPYGHDVDNALMGKIKPDMRKRLNEIEPHLFEMIANSGLPAEYNDYCLEGKNVQTCGRHC